MKRVQPARYIMQEQRWTTRRAAEAIGADFSHLQNVLLGRSRPDEIVRKRLPELLNTPIEQLFDLELYVLPHTGRHGAKPGAWKKAAGQNG